MSQTTDGDDLLEESTQKKGNSLSSASSDAIKTEMDAVLSDLENLDLSGDEDDFQVEAESIAGGPGAMTEIELLDASDGADDEFIDEIGFDMDGSDDFDTQPGRDEKSSEDEDEMALLREFGMSAVVDAAPEDSSEVASDTDTSERHISAERLETAERTIADLRRQLHRITSDNAARTKSLEQMRDNAQDRLQRTVSEFNNFRRRAEREREEAISFGNEKLLKSIIPVIDNLQIALAHADHSGSDDFVSGVQMVHDLMLQSLQRQGMTSFESKGELFDPERHEAVSRIENDDLPENTVIEQLQKGYFLNERLLRPAKVTVSCTSPAKNEALAALEESDIGVVGATASKEDSDIDEERMAVQDEASDPELQDDVEGEPSSSSIEATNSDDIDGDPLVEADESIEQNEHSSVSDEVVDDGAEADTDNEPSLEAESVDAEVDDPDGESS